MEGRMQVILLFLVLASASAQDILATTNTSTVACGESKVDIVFLLDSSFSEGKTNFKKQLEFARNFTKPFDIGPNKVQISVATFSTAPHNGFYLNAHRDKQSLLTAIDNVTYTGGATFTDKALHYVRNTTLTASHGARLGVPKIVIVMTDGQSSSPSRTLTEATLLHLTGTKVISIGIGSGVKTTELNTIASDRQHAFTVASFNALNTIQTEIQQSACTSEKVLCTNQYADVVFLLDASSSEGATNFYQQVDFVKNFTKGFNVGPSSVQVSVVTFATDVLNQFWLSDYGIKNDILKAMDNITYSSGTTNTDKALKFIRENSFLTMNGGRTTAPHLVFVLTDGNSLHRNRTAEEAKLLAKANVKVVSIGIGSGISTDELQAISQDKSRAVNVSDFNALGSLLNQLQVTTCTAPLECGAQADIVFILDASSSEGSTNFNKQLTFMMDFVKRLDIGPTKVQIGMVTFSSTGHSEFYFNSYTDKFSVLGRIQSTRYRGGTTATDSGLRSAEYQFQTYHGARPNATKIAILLTDGRSNSVSATLREAHKLQSKGVKIITIGIGSSINKYELNTVATNRNYAFQVGSFDILHTIENELRESTCGELKPKPTPNPECGGKPTDIVFVLDSSASEGRTNFQKQVDFVRNFVYQFTIGPQNVQVSVVVFSTNVYEQFQLDKYNDSQSLLSGISKISYHSGTTYTDKALAFVRQNSFNVSKGARPNATDLVVVITDGQSTSASKTRVEAALLKNQTGLEVIAIGIGSGVSHTELETIATDHNHALYSASFGALQQLISDLTFAACETCSFAQKADILFLLDASSSEGTSNFQKQLDFVSRVANDFNIGPNNVQIGVVTFSDSPHNEFNLKDHTTKSSLLSAIQRIPYMHGVTNTDQALSYIRQNGFVASAGGRTDAKNYVVVLTDGASAHQNLTLAEANLLKQSGVTVLAIGIGSNVNTQEINGIASDSKHAFTVNNFNALQTIQNEIKQAACESVVTTTTTPLVTASTAVTTRTLPPATSTMPDMSTSKAPCEDFSCQKDCGILGYQVDKNGCPMCACQQ